MSIQQNFPNTRPSLNLNFARSQKLDPRITFTRTSSATRVNSDGLIEVVPANQPRFDFDPVTGECLGLLIEEQRSNLLLRSEEFNDVYWDSNAVISSNTSISPDGTVDADTMPAGITNYIRKPVSSLTANVPYTFSVWIKSANIGQHASLRIHLSPGQPIPEQSLQITTTDIWTRYSVTVNINSTQLFCQIGEWSSLNYGPTQPILIWGAQLEQGPFPTSYIPTTTSTVTRTADIANISGTNFTDWYNQSQGTILVAHQAYQPQITSFDRIWSITDGTSNNSLSIYYAANAQRVDVLKRISQVNNFVAGGLSSAHNLNNKTIFIYSDTECGTTSNGQTFTPSNVSGSFTASQLNIGASEFLFRSRIYISQLLYYPSRLSNTQLQELTK